MKSKILFIVMCGTIAMTTSIREMAPDLKESQKNDPRHFLLVGRKARDGIVKNDFMI